MEVEKAGLHKDFKDCEGNIVTSKLNGDNLHLYLGYNKKESEYYFAFGQDKPYKMSKLELSYLISALTGLANQMFGAMEEESFNNYVRENLGTAKMNIKFGSTSEFSENVKKDGLESIAKDLMDQLEGKAKSEDSEMPDLPKELLDKLEDAKAEAEDFQELMESLSPEEREKLAKVADEEREKKLEEKAKALEAVLLGELKEDDQVLDITYFEKIFKEHGAERLKEELARIPKEERGQIINKITKDFQKKQEEKLNSRKEEDDVVE